MKAISDYTVFALAIVICMVNVATSTRWNVLDTARQGFRVAKIKTFHEPPRNEFDEPISNLLSPVQCLIPVRSDYQDKKLRQQYAIFGDNEPLEYKDELIEGLHLKTVDTITVYASSKEIYQVYTILNGKAKTLHWAKAPKAVPKNKQPKEKLDSNPTDIQLKILTPKKTTRRQKEPTEKQEVITRIQRESLKFLIEPGNKSRLVTMRGHLIVEEGKPDRYLELEIQGTQTVQISCLSTKEEVSKPPMTGSARLDQRPIDSDAKSFAVSLDVGGQPLWYRSTAENRQYTSIEFFQGPFKLEQSTKKDGFQCITPFYETASDTPSITGKALSSTPMIAATPLSRAANLGGGPQSRTPRIAATPPLRTGNIAGGPQSRTPSIAATPPLRTSNIAGGPQSRTPSIAATPPSKTPTTASGSLSSPQGYPHERLMSSPWENNSPHSSERPVRSPELSSLPPFTSRKPESHEVGLRLGGDQGPKPGITQLYYSDESDLSDEEDNDHGGHSGYSYGHPGTTQSGSSRSSDQNHVQGIGQQGRGQNVAAGHRDLGCGSSRSCDQNRDQGIGQQGRGQNFAAGHRDLGNSPYGDIRSFYEDYPQNADHNGFNELS